MAFIMASQKARWRLIVHPISEQLFLDGGIPFEKAAAVFDTLPADRQSLQNYLGGERISHLVCTTSAREHDLTNARLIEAARNVGVPSLGVLDHWKGYTRFLDEHNAPSYMPEHLACIDDTCVGRVSDLYSKAKLYVVGHPHLERCVWRPLGVGDTCKIVIVSQPEARDGSFRSVFAQSISGRNLVQDIAANVPSTVGGRRTELFFRPHPKDAGVPELPIDVSIDGNGDWSDALYKYDFILGFDSMALIEAALSGRRVAIVGWPSSQNQSDSNIPFPYGPVLMAAPELRTEIEQVIEEDQSESSRHPSLNIFNGSTDRLSQLIKKFVN
tara:strand:+ start:578 stop:1561 length:984 start_codon:yes stop_codon:yes gene_type:complete